MTYTYRLAMRTGPNPGQIIPLDKTEFVMGRDLNNDIVINDSEVSRKHAKIYVFGQGFVIEDLGSTNGTFVNGQRISGPHNLIPGELVALGDQTTLLFEVGEMDEDATKVSPSPMQAVPQPRPTAPQPQYQEPQVFQQPIQAAPISPQPVHSQPMPSYAGSIPVAAPASKPKKKSKLGLIIIILIILMLCACVVFWVVVDQLNWYCDLFPGIMNAIFGAGACP